MGFRLNLASGTDIRDGWINLDVVKRWPLARRECDIVWDARTDKLPFPDASVDEIYAGYLLMHVAPCYHTQILNDIHRVLAPTGKLMVGEVDMNIVMQMFLNNSLDQRCHELIWGEQGTIHGQDLAAFDKHCHGFTESSLRHVLTVHNFTNIQRVSIHHPGVFYELTLLADTDKPH